MIIQSIALILIAPALLATLYYAFFALVTILRRPKQNLSIEISTDYTFAIVIPAHNEEMVIARTIQTCRNLDYPRDKFTIYVIADNCSDDTASIARREGAKCLERSDTSRRGKGFALAWAFEQLLVHDYDAIVVLDADCKITRNALKGFGWLMKHGHEVLQAKDIVSNPDEAPLSYALAIGNTLENEFFCSPKSYLSLPVSLRGTGMVFKREILLEYPWNASSIAEDKEYFLRLVKSGKVVKFVDNVIVSSEFPIEKKQLGIQRERWAKGNFKLSKVESINLIRQGLSTRDIKLIDVGISLLVDSKPLLLLETVAACVASALSTIFVPNSVSIFLLVGIVITIVLQISYLSLGVIKLGVTTKRLRFLLNLPFVVMRMIAISFKALMADSEDVWQKTPRI